MGVRGEESHTANHWVPTREFSFCEDVHERDVLFSQQRHVPAASCEPHMSGITGVSIHGDNRAVSHFVRNQANVGQVRGGEDFTATCKQVAATPPAPQAALLCSSEASVPNSCQGISQLGDWWVVPLASVSLRPFGVLVATSCSLQGPRVKRCSVCLTEQVCLGDSYCFQETKAPERCRRQEGMGQEGE